MSRHVFKAFVATVAVAAVFLANNGSFAATYDVGPGQVYTNLGQIAWTSLAAGDTVNIHCKPGGYHEVIMLSASGTSNAPITLNGIPDPQTGALPVLDGDNAMTATNTPWRSIFFNKEGVIVVSRAAGTAYGYIPSWIVVQNLHIQNADPTHSVKQSDSVQTNFDSFATGIYVEYAQHFVVRGCEINGCCNGFFCNSKDNAAQELSADMLIERCWIHDNGYPGNYGVHNIYTEAKGVTFQYNLIGPLRPGADGEQIKDRSSGTVLRYNMMIVAPGPGTAFWFEQTQNGIGLIDVDPAYRQTFVYGNVFYNPPNSSAIQMFRYDALGIEGQPRNGTLYFYNNTVVNHANQSQRYGTSIFSLPNHSEVLQWNVHDVVDCRNNIFAALPATAGQPTTLVSMLVSDDSTINFGPNWISPGASMVALPWLATNFYGTLTGTNQLTFGSAQNNPGFASLAATNFHLLASSPAIDAAGPQSPVVAAGPYNDLLEYVSMTNCHPRVNNGKAPDLGAFEGISTNVAGSVYTLTISNGLGAGSFATGTIVPILANTPPAGQIFAGWTGFVTANALSPNTTLTMPASNITVTATYSNAPPPVYYTLTVSNGLGSGSYLGGTNVSISANNPPSGQAFAGWTGYPVANPAAAVTSLIMPGSNLTVTATYTNTPIAAQHTLTVVNGSGSGSYAAGTTIAINANVAAAGQVFAGWTGFAVADPTAVTTTLVMPATNTSVRANYQSTGPVPTAFPPPVASHPRLWLTTNDLPKLRQWAVSSNPIYQKGFLPLLQKATADYQTQFFPGGVANTNYPDPGDVQGYQGLLTEEYAFILAFGSLIDPNPALRSQYATYARNIIMYAMNQAVLGHAANVPFRDPAFAVYNRANGSGENWGLAVDWIYNAIGTNGAPVLSQSDKLTIRNVFMLWAADCIKASTTGGDHPEPIGVLNNHQLLPNGDAYRMAANNYYAGHVRLMTLDALAFDPADDPPVDTNQSVSVLGNSLRSYLDDAVGAWLYQQYAMMGEPASVISDYGLADNASVGIASGGLPPEGMLYGHSMGFVLGQLLALQTAGYNNPQLIGPQARLITSPVWGRFSSGVISSLVPAAQVPPAEAYMGPVFEMNSYGDILRLWITPDYMEPFALLALVEQQNGLSTHYEAARWFVTDAVEGGANALLTRASNPWSYGVTESVLYFMLLDPKLAAPADPRPTFPLAFQDSYQGRIVDRTAWNANARQFAYLASWISINHQQAAAGQFEFYRNGEWMTKEVSNYDDNNNGQSTIWHNTLALKNWCTAGTPNVGYEAPFFVNGSEWVLGEAAGDPTTRTTSSPDYTFANSDLTPLFNRPSYWTPENACLDIQEASRHVIWLKPDHIVIYDRATSLHSGLFKRFNLNFVTQPVISGKSITETTPGGQKLFVQSLLPANASIQYVPLANSLTSVAELEPSTGRIIVEDTNMPANTRFLHVLQGADAGASADAVTLIRSSSGNPFEGAAVRGEIALFAVNALSNNFSSTTYSAPGGITNHFIAGLAPNGAYAVSVVPGGGQQQVTVSAGTGLNADSAGLLAFDSNGRSLTATSPRLFPGGRSANSMQLTASGMANVQYTVQASTNLATTNWIPIGAANADQSGKIQFTDGNATNALRFYRLFKP